MLIIISGKLYRRPKAKRQVTYQPEQPRKTEQRTMSDLFQEQSEQDRKKEEELERRFRQRLRQTANGWQYAYQKAS